MIVTSSFAKGYIVYSGVFKAAGRVE